MPSHHYHLAQVNVALMLAPLHSPTMAEFAALLPLETRFHYRQRGARVWATYAEGSVRFGSLVAVQNSDGRLDMRYNHLGPEGTLRTGACKAATEMLSDGRIRLLEEWQWTNGDLSVGKSVVEELRT